MSAPTMYLLQKYDRFFHSNDRLLLFDFESVNMISRQLFSQNQAAFYWIKFSLFLHSSLGEAFNGPSD